MKKKFFHYALRITHFALLMAIFFTAQEVHAVDWYWLDSNEKYSKYFNPDSVVVNKKVVTRDGREIAIEIEAWTKTTYSYEGAAETIKNYELKNILPDPKSLSYSLALIRVNPQNRTLQYVREDFYNPQDQVVWSKAEGRVVEINSQKFDEEFYCAIVDEVFRMGERDRKRAPASERWLDLWTYTDAEGTTTSLSADTTTMRLKGSNLVLWEWQVTKNSDGKTGKYLRGEATGIVQRNKRRNPVGWVKVSGAAHNNLKNIDVNIPVGVFACISGVSGSGKSSFLYDVLYKGMRRINSEQPARRARLGERKYFLHGRRPRLFAGHSPAENFNPQPHAD